MIFYITFYNINKRGHCQTMSVKMWGCEKITKKVTVKRSESRGSTILAFKLIIVQDKLINNIFRL